MTARYWIAQHISDLFRNEPRNIGVFVKSGTTLAARFFGETAENQLDGRKLKGFPYADVYRQWVDYWRSEIAHNEAVKPDDLGGAHYRVIPAGEVTEIGIDAPDDIANYLYLMLVSEGGFREAIGAEDAAEEQAFVALEADLSNALRVSNLLSDNGDLLVPHPIRRGVDIRGFTVAHKPAFVQENGRLYVMETVDFTVAHKKRSRDHAGWAAYMFHDIRAGRQGSEAIAIIRCTDEERELEEVQNGLALIRNEAEIVNWLDERERRQFIESRRDVAFHSDN